MIVKAEPHDEEKDKDFKLTCKWNVYNMKKKKQWLGGQQIFARDLATIYKMYWKLIEVFSQEISGTSNIIWKKKLPLRLSQFWFPLISSHWLDATRSLAEFGYHS